MNNVAVNRDTSRNPIFDVMFTLHSIEQGNNEGNEQKTLKGDEQEPLQSPLNPEQHHPGNAFRIGTSKFDMSFDIIESVDQLTCSIEYGSKLFKQETIQRFALYFEKIARAAASNPDGKISQMEMISAEEKEQLLYGFNNTTLEYPKNIILQEWFQQQVVKTPHRIAITFGNSHVTYSDLNARANQISILLREKGVKPDTIVAIMVERSLNMVAGILGVLKAGGAYLPIDSETPSTENTIYAGRQSFRIIVDNKSWAGNVQR